MLQAFKLFYDTSRLQANQYKSAFYCCGMKEEDTRRVQEVSGFALSQLSFRYSGVPICSKRISVGHCDGLIENMICIIELWGSRNLSYMARITLINSILMSIHMYWAQVYILPRSVLKEINKICRSFLWSGHIYSHRPGLVAWDKLCCDKKEGGLGFKNIDRWNLTFMDRYGLLQPKKIMLGSGGLM